MVVKRYQELESDLNALNRFIKQQQTIASDIMSVSLPCRYPFASLINVDCRTL